MDVELLRNFCKSLPAVREDIKWGNDLCFTVGEKMFCVVGLDPAHRFSFKVTDEEFDEVSARDGFIPAPYMARNKWVSVENADRVGQKEWEHFVRQSYELIKANLTRKTRLALGIGTPEDTPTAKKTTTTKPAAKKKAQKPVKQATKKKSPAKKTAARKTAAPRRPAAKKSAKKK